MMADAKHLRPLRHNMETSNGDENNEHDNNRNNNNDNTTQLGCRQEEHALQPNPKKEHNSK